MTARALLIWAVPLAAIAVSVVFAATSPLLAYRSPIYIIAGLAGVAAMTLLLVQPLLAARLLPSLSPIQSRRLHRAVGVSLVVAIVIHVAALWVTSPPDVVDALLLRSPTLFSFWGVVAMWAVFATATLALLRRRVRARLWRNAHKSLAVVIVLGSVVHALLIEGTMEPISKTVLCALVLAGTAWALLKRRV